MEVSPEWMLWIRSNGFGSQWECARSSFVGRHCYIATLLLLHPLAECWRFVSLECILGAVWKSTKFLCGCHKKDVNLFFQQNLEYCIHDQIICIRMKTFWQFIICKKCNCSRVGIQHMCLDQSQSQFFELSTTGNKTRKRVMANIAKSKTSFYRSPAVVIVIKKASAWTR